MEKFRFHKMKFPNFLLIVSFFVCSNHSFTQHQRLENLKNFDKNVWTFGVQMGFNSTGFNFTPALNAYSSYGFRSIIAESLPGAQVGLLASLKLGSPILRLRAIPTFSFQERVIKYYSAPKKNQVAETYNEERVNSSNVDVPLLLQIRTLRYGNFTAFALTGMQFSIDLQSMQDKSQNYIDPFIKIRKKDWMAQFGGGVEFFYEYFKLGVEVKYSQGFNNVLIQDMSPVSNPLNSLYNHSWIFTITFES
jgi:hypothetical protein